MILLIVLLGELKTNFLKIAKSQSATVTILEFVLQDQIQINLVLKFQNAWQAAHQEMLVMLLPLLVPELMEKLFVTVDLTLVMTKPIALKILVMLILDIAITNLFQMERIALLNVKLMTSVSNGQSNLGLMQPAKPQNATNQRNLAMLLLKQINLDVMVAANTANQEMLVKKPLASKIKKENLHANVPLSNVTIVILVLLIPVLMEVAFTNSLKTNSAKNANVIPNVLLGERL